MLRRIAVVIALAAGCSGGPGTNDPVAPTEPVAKPTKSLAESKSPEVRELAAAVREVVDDAEARSWIEAATAEFPTPLDGRPPVPVQRAWDALLAWEANPSAIDLPCHHPDVAFAADVLGIAKAALAPARDESDPLLKAALHLGYVFSRPTNGLVVVAVGVELWQATEAWRIRTGRQALAASESLALTEEDLLEAGRTDLRCTIAKARAATRDAATWTSERMTLEERRRELRMPMEGEWFDDELASHAAFWAETEELLGTVTSLDRLRALHGERRRTATTHLTSALVRTIGEALLLESTPLLLEDLEAIIRK